MKVRLSRMTAALDAAGCHGARVDKVLGGTEPMVDQWEAGRLEPDPIQVFWLAELTGVPLDWLLDPSPWIVAARVCPGFIPIYERPPGADPERAEEILKQYRRLYRDRNPLTSWGAPS